MAATENLEFYKEDEEGEKIIKEKIIERMTDEELAKEIANVVLSKSEYKQIVTFWNPIELPMNPPGWNCTFRTQIIPLSQTCDDEVIKHSETPLCLSFEYRDKEYWVMKVVKEDKKYRGRIEGIRIMMRGALEAKKN
ncbi:unnamed protein product [marine sediment metagenome]|uniref:Uncharacterized protein n=1 Tax=marine sediment metagenome TaxID=412755 RepID=X1NZ51_9ZZZZ